MRLLDLFCGAGGASMGYHRAGFDVVGVDVVAQPEYPFPFVQADALAPPFDLAGFDLIHASPPCQAYSRATPADASHPRHVEAVRSLLMDSGKPWVIENVEGSPLKVAAPLFDEHGATLCGSMFGLEVETGYLRRHRLFESSFPIPVLDCRHPRSKRALAVYGHQGAGAFAHHVGPTKTEADEVMGIDWMRWGTLKEAIPPAYTEYIGRAFLDLLGAT